MSEKLEDCVADVSELERRLGYTFVNKELLELALTHPSFKNEHPEVRGHNQRLEFLGDAVLELVVAERLFLALPEVSEGRLTRLKASLVSMKRLAHVAKKLELFEFVKVGKGAKKMDAVLERERVLCACLEAVIGAVFVDGGYEAVKRCVTSLFAQEIEDTLARQDEKDAKSFLQEIVQKRWKRAPLYRLIRREGPSHAPTHFAEVLLPDGSVFQGRGRSKKEAEGMAAAMAIKAIVGETEN